MATDTEARRANLVAKLEMSKFSINKTYGELKMWQDRIDALEEELDALENDAATWEERGSI